jgi:hypothetical protein
MSYKVMVAFGEQTFRLLSEEARARGITIQELMLDTSQLQAGARSSRERQGKKSQ